MPATTANGVVMLAPVVLVEVIVGEVAVRNVPAAFPQYASGRPAWDVVPFKIVAF
jgi:predicted aspartyl protease